MRYSKIALTAEGDCLTSGETHLIWRRREGLNQSQAAEELGWSVKKYKQAERDVRDEEPRDIREVHHHERALVYRRRASQTQREVAAALGVSRLWVNRMERGLADCSPLIEYWEC